MSTDATPQLETHTLPRNGQRPVRFTGTRLAHVSGVRHNGTDQNRYYELTMYVHEDGRYVLHILYVSRWQGEDIVSTVHLFKPPTNAIAYLEVFDPTEDLVGFKPLLARQHDEEATEAHYYRGRQDILEDQIRRQFAALVSELCSQLGIVEEL